ncbi:MAG: glycosyltransferase [Winogradskyella arenosi]
MKLVIISHTEHYTLPDGSVVGWGPTITEINHLTRIFDCIVHVAMLQPGEAPPSALPYTNSNVSFVALPAVGGSGIVAKWKVVQAAPKVIKIVNQELKSADYFQLRTPTGIGVYLIPYLSHVSKIPGWFKYAGNWNQEKPPMGYGIQRWLLKHQSRPVTINGSWPNQPKHCITFENPCLTAKDLSMGLEVLSSKTFLGPLHLCYVGRLESPKGVGRFISALRTLDPVIKAKLGEVHLVGDGAERQAFEAEAALSGISIKFYGFLPRDQVFDIYKVCHGFVMPTTASEGFPKVLAEAMAFGCVPLVSDVSAIGQYIKTGCNGFIFDTVSVESIQKTLKAFTNMSNNNYLELIHHSKAVVAQFTFNYYNNHLKDSVISEL